MMVQFNQIEIIELPIILGDHPACRSGPAMQLSWDVQRRITMNLETYETNRKQRRQKSQLLLSQDERTRLLQKNGVPMNDIIAGSVWKGLETMQLSYFSRRTRHCSNNNISSSPKSCFKVSQQDPSSSLQTFSQQQSIEELNKQVEELVRQLRSRDEMIQIRKNHKSTKGRKMHHHHGYHNQGKKLCWKNLNDSSSSSSTRSF